MLKENHIAMSSTTHGKLQEEYHSVVLVLDFTKIGIPKYENQNLELKMQINNDLKEDEIIINIKNDIYETTLDQYKACIIDA